MRRQSCVSATVTPERHHLSSSRFTNFLLLTTIYGTLRRHQQGCRRVTLKTSLQKPASYDHIFCDHGRPGFLFMFSFLVFSSPDFYNSLAQRLHFRTHCHSVACIPFQRAFRCRTLASQKTMSVEIHSQSIHVHTIWAGLMTVFNGSLG